MKNKPAKQGRPQIKERLMNFKLSPGSVKAIQSMADRKGWTMTRIVERAIMFADNHPEFDEFHRAANGNVSPATKSASNPTNKPARLLSGPSSY